MIGLGYPCINTTIGCTAGSGFRLRNYSDEKETVSVDANLTCLEKMLRYNAEKGLLFFRIGSGLVPFASHPACRYDWKKHFAGRLEKVGALALEKGIRISIHPDQFVLINSPRRKVVLNSISELAYACHLLEAMKLGPDAKVQIHIGGGYGNKKKSMGNFIREYLSLPQMIKKRLVIENDHKIYSLADALEIHSRVGLPVLFDSFHHECLSAGETLREALGLASATWRKKDGPLMCDYSQARPGAARGTHADSINLDRFREFMETAQDYDMDIMLEIKNKQKSALAALRFLKKEYREILRRD